MNMKRYNVLLLVLCIIIHPLRAADLWVEAEAFAKKGGWVVDQQFMEQLGSSYLMAHGMGKPVADATTEVEFPEAGTYYGYVRTFNWTSPWFKGAGPGKFSLAINGRTVGAELGTSGNSWMWQAVGKVQVTNRKTVLSLKDLTGFNGRCDAIYFTTKPGSLPPSEKVALQKFRKQKLALPDVPPTAGQYDLVVVGGGIAGMSAAASAARLGCRVALVQDRPVLGGNNSSEVRVHLGGRIEAKPYPELGNLQKEFGPIRGGNAQPKDFYEDEKKAAFIAAEKNITLYDCYHAYNVKKSGNTIHSIYARHIESGKEIALSAPVFADCTGDGTIGWLAGADYHVGREAKSEYQEPTAPEKSDKQTMGASVQWYSVDDKKPSSFPVFNYGMSFNAQSSERVTMGEWTWETGMNRDQIEEAEYIRDYGLLVVFANWSFLKNGYTGKQEYANRSLGWVAYIAGKRESRRLLGDMILTENDLTKAVKYPDATGSTTWTIDLHYPDPANTKYFPLAEFKSICKMTKIYPYPIPYRCLYSRNVSNLFMAGRNISVTHVALGTIRVMRTTGILGEVVGMAASLCKKHKAEPKAIFPSHFEELKGLMEKGVSREKLPNNQKYNEGETLGPR